MITEIIPKKVINIILLMNVNGMRVLMKYYTYKLKRKYTFYSRSYTYAVY